MLPGQQILNNRRIMRVFKVMDYGGMAGAKFAAKSAQKVREVEDEVLRLCGELGGETA